MLQSISKSVQILQKKKRGDVCTQAKLAVLFARGFVQNRQLRSNYLRSGVLFFGGASEAAVVFMACLFVEKLIFESFPLKPQSSFLNTQKF